MEELFPCTQQAVVKLNLTLPPKHDGLNRRRAFCRQVEFAIPRRQAWIQD